MLREWPKKWQKDKKQASKQTNKPWVYSHDSASPSQVAEPRHPLGWANYLGWMSELSAFSCCRAFPSGAFASLSLMNLAFNSLIKVTSYLSLVLYFLSVIVPSSVFLFYILFSDHVSVCISSLSSLLGEESPEDRHCLIHSCSNIICQMKKKNSTIWTIKKSRLVLKDMRVL